MEYWRGYKLHLSVIDGDVPISAVLTSASTHDSQVAIPLMQMSAQRVTGLYDLMDSAYDAEAIHTFCSSLGHVPIIEPVQRGNWIKQSVEKPRRVLGQLEHIASARAGMSGQRHGHRRKIDPHHPARRPRRLRRKDQPRARRAAEVQDMVPPPDDAAALLNLLQLVHGPGRILFLAGPPRVGVIVPAVGFRSPPPDVLVPAVGRQCPSCI
jgi:hypothetical protein